MHDKDQEDEVNDQGEVVKSSGVIVYRDYSLMKRNQTDGKEIDLS